MGSRVPLQLKKKILQEWLKGISRDSIAINNKIFVAERYPKYNKEMSGLIIRYKI